MKNEPHIVVGITGRSGSGKTTVSRAVVERFKFHRPLIRPACVMKFAQPIRDALRQIGVEKGDEPGTQASPYFRSAAQGLGQLMRKADPDFWVNALEHAVAGQSAPTVVLVDDLRFPNEARVCDLVFQLRTDRDNGLTPEQMLDTSETAYEAIPCSAVYHNDAMGDISLIADSVFEKIREALK